MIMLKSIISISELHKWHVRGGLYYSTYEMFVSEIQSLFGRLYKALF